MFGVRVRLLCLATLCSTALATVETDARTVLDLPSAETEPLGEFSLSDLLRSDPLGGECIAEDDIDLAFFASGKGLRLPRTCLPEPCTEALTQVRLAELIGRPAHPSEWDAYFSRYADVCRKEIVSFDDGAAQPGPVSPQAFWAPILATAGVSTPASRPPIAPVRVFSRAEPDDGFTSTGGTGAGGAGAGAGRSTSADGGNSAGGDGSGNSAGGDAGGDGSAGNGSSPSSTSGDENSETSTVSTRLIGDPNPDGDPTTSTTLRQRPPTDPDGAAAPSVVPLPLGGWLLLSALGGLAALRRTADARRFAA